MNVKEHGAYRTGEFISRDLEFFIAYTLIDITDTGISFIKNNSDDDKKKQFNQAQNLNVFIQAIGLRSQPIVSSVAQVPQQNLATAPYNKFSLKTGNHNVWVLKFTTDFKGAWDKNVGDFYYLIEGLHDIPIISEAMVDSSASIPSQKIQTKGNAINTFFERSDVL